MQLFEELKRRNVFRVGAAYAVVAWLLLQIADLVLDNISAPDWVMQVLLLVVAVGFPLALLLAWAFELTPGGLKLEADVDRSQSIVSKTGKKLDRVIIGVLLVIVSVMAVERVWFAADDVADDQAEVAEVVTDKSIAVLPFVDLSEAQDQEWFAKGLTDEILNALMRTPDLLVASRTSSFKYIGSDLDIREIANELGVAHIVEGSIRRSGESIRVTAQLIRASDGFHLWSENYDRQLSDVIVIQEDLAVSIARALQTGMDPEALREMMVAGTRSVEAYEHYINGLALELDYYAYSNYDSLNASNEEFEKARSIDPEFARAHEASANFWEGQLQLTSRLARATDYSPIADLARFDERIDAAIKHADDEVERWLYEASRATVHVEVRKSLQFLMRVLDARPNYVAGWQAMLSESIQWSDFEMANKAADRLLEIYESTPEETQALSLLISLHRIGRGSEAITLANQAVRDYPGNVSIAYQAHRALLWAGATEDAAAILPLLANDVEASYAVASARQACAEGRRADAEQLLSEMTEASSEDIYVKSASWHIYMLLGRVDEANDVIRDTSSPDVLYQRAAWLFYRHFDPTPFPEVMAILQREKIDRGPPVTMPFACK
jgi:TolB-like protein/thioredoxin-like negative regulator of GroEL